MHVFYKIVINRKISKPERTCHGDIFTKVADLDLHFCYNRRHEITKQCNIGRVP